MKNAVETFYDIMSYIDADSMDCELFNRTVPVLQKLCEKLDQLINVEVSPNGDIYYIDHSATLDIDNNECWITQADVENGEECASCINGKCPLSHDLYLDCVLRAYDKENNI